MCHQLKRFGLVFLAVGLFGLTNGQRKIADSLFQIIARTSNDTTRYIATANLIDAYKNIDLDSGVYYAQQLLLLSKRFEDPNAALDALTAYGSALFFAGHYPDALKVAFRVLQQAESAKDSGSMASANMLIGFVYRNSDEYRKAIEYFNRYKVLAEHFNDNNMRAFFYAESARAYEQLNILDTALQYNQTALKLSDQRNTPFGAQGVFCNIGTIKSKLGRNDDALRYFRQAASLSSQWEDFRTLARCYTELGKHFYSRRSIDSALWYSRIALNIDTMHAFTVQTIEAATLLTTVFSNLEKYDSAFKYQQIMLDARERLFNREKLAQLQNQAFNDQLYRQELAVERTLSENRFKIYGLLAALLVLSVAGALLWRNSRQQQRAKRKLEKAYSELKATQAQLIQKEKMASLGELAAGIAHEIQNPLNFVNNFAETNAELLEEAQAGLQAGNSEETFFLLNDIKANEQKILHHGRRADSIVKGMLQHARTSSSTKEWTNINQLADEYLRLSYQSIRARDKAFSAHIKTDFDATAGDVLVVPQDIGRVLLNLFNNAFYAVAEKKQQLNGSFEPVVSVSTKKEGSHVLIAVKDNGTGMSPNVAAKVFQPFFTTKPTGEGTGLGLSLSYDIITKGHGGEMKVDTREGEGAAFIVQLPISK